MKECFGYFTNIPKREAAICFECTLKKRCMTELVNKTIPKLKKVQTVKKELLKQGLTCDY